MAAEPAAEPTTSEEEGRGGGGGGGLGGEDNASASADDNSNFEWENSKENVRPLRRGRKVDSIHATAYGGGLGGGPGLGGGGSTSARVLADLKRWVCTAHCCCMHVSYSNTVKCGWCRTYRLTAVRVC